MKYYVLQSGSENDAYPEGTYYSESIKNATEFLYKATLYEETSKFIERIRETVDSKIWSVVEVKMDNVLTPYFNLYQLKKGE